MKIFLFFLILIGVMSQDSESNVKVLDWDSYKAIKADSSADVLVTKVYAPWCGHCKRIAATWEEVGDRFADHENVIVAEWDASKDNTILNHFKANGYPTIIIESLKDKFEPQKFEKARTADNFEEWIKEFI